MRIVSTICRLALGLIGIANLLLGTVIIIFIIWTLNTADSLHLVISGKSLIFGLIISIKGLLGIFGACQQQKCLLKFLLFLAVMSCSIEIGTFISLKVADVKIADLVEQSWSEANQNTRNYAQRELRCCGLTGLSEFASKLDPVDESCYPSGQNTNNSIKQPYRVGCKGKLIEWLKSRKSKFFGGILALLLSQMLSVLLVLLLIRHRKDLEHVTDRYQEEMLLSQRTNR